MLCSVVIPVYNSGKSLIELYDRLNKAFHEDIGTDFEVIFVDDASVDDSFAVIMELKEQHDNIKAIQFSRNYGQHKATICGFEYAKGDFVLTMDDDLQHPPEEIRKLWDHLTSHDEIDVVVGTFSDKKHSAIRNLGSKLNHFVASTVVKKNQLNFRMTAFRLMRSYVAKAIARTTASMPRVGYVMRAVTNRIAGVAVRHDERKYGESGYSFFRLVRDFESNLLNNSDFPLRVVGVVGNLCCMFSIVMVIYYLIRYFTNGISMSGFTTIVILILFFSGVIMFSISIVGKYLIRILTEARKDQLYTIRRTEL